MAIESRVRTYHIGMIQFTKQRYFPNHIAWHTTFRRGIGKRNPFNGHDIASVFLSSFIHLSKTNKCEIARNNDHGHCSIDLQFRTLLDQSFLFCVHMNQDTTGPTLSDIDVSNNTYLSYEIKKAKITSTKQSTSLTFRIQSMLVHRPYPLDRTTDCHSADPHFYFDCHFRPLDWLVQDSGCCCPSPHHLPHHTYLHP
jgi:hypothetical protein